MRRGKTQNCRHRRCWRRVRMGSRCKFWYMHDVIYDRIRISGDGRQSSFLLDHVKSLHRSWTGTGTFLHRTHSSKVVESRAVDESRQIARFLPHEPWGDARCHRNYIEENWRRLTRSRRVRFLSARTTDTNSAKWQTVTPLINRRWAVYYFERWIRIDCSSQLLTRERFDMHFDPYPMSLARRFHISGCARQIVNRINARSSKIQ